MAYKRIAPRVFPHTARDESTQKRQGWPPSLRQAHANVVGGREGESVAGRLALEWDGKPSTEWTEQLREGHTYPSARTQSPFLRRVRPEQRAWARGVMRVSDMERILFGGRVREDRIDIEIPKVKGQYPRFEITWWLEEEGAFGAVTGRASFLRQVTTADDGAVRRLGIDEAKNTIVRASNVVDTPLYAESMGFIFEPDVEAQNIQGVPKEGLAIPYFMVGRVRRIYPEARRVRVASLPSPDANTPYDASFNEKIQGLMQAQRRHVVDAAVQRLTEPNRVYRADITPTLEVRAVGEPEGVFGLVYQGGGALDGASQVADAVSAMNVARTVSAQDRAIRGKEASVLDDPHDTLREGAPRKKRKGKRKLKQSLLDNPGPAYRIVRALADGGAIVQPCRREVSGRIVYGAFSRVSAADLARLRLFC